MKIKETFVSFTGIFQTGQYALFIYMDNQAVDLNIDELLIKCLQYRKIIFCGEDPLKQKEELGKLISKIHKKDETITTEIYTNGIIKPVQIGNIKTVNYRVEVLLGNSGIEYEQRIKDSTILWYNQMNADFIFLIEHKDQLDEVNLLISAFDIPRKRVHLGTKGEITTENLVLLLDICTKFKYNMYVDFKDAFWPMHGREE